MKLHRISATAFACVLLLGACQQGNEADTQEDEEEASPIPVETGTPVRGDVLAVYSGTAPIEAFAEADVIAKVDGEIREVLAEEGDDVTEGQIMARLDGDRLRLELNESSARLRKMQRDFERNKDLREKGLLSEGDYEKLRFDLEALQASYNLASLELDYTQIRAPIDGVISERYIKIGNTIKVGDPLYRVTGLDPLVAYLHVPEREYRQISAGQPVAIDIDALAGQRIFATVTRISPIVDAATGTFKTTIEIRDDTRRIKPGMFGRMSIVYDRHENVLKIPRSAIVEELGSESVFVVEDGKAIRRAVTTGYGENGMIEIIEGLTETDNVVTVGQVGLKPDATVTVINAPATDELEAQVETESADSDDASGTVADGSD
ncbi:MAG: efflux RND transporter periplasmic adaptor subunit [Gammaproteobacteria bacterium]|nr:efflux RND transporter periplasmic adaptor subunit [Gammaproteobacteria bacterium]MDH3759325.1 efflux RND transporter periplasmic adaptor subunit [Gammaproteobacteria bacterium]